MSLKNVINININLTSSNNGGLFTLEFEPRDGDCNFPNETEINSLKPPVRRESPMKWKWKWKCQTGGKEQVGVRLGVWNRRSWRGKSRGPKNQCGCLLCLSPLSQQHSLVAGVETEATCNVAKSQLHQGEDAVGGPAMATVTGQQSAVVSLSALAKQMWNLFFSGERNEIYIM